MVVEQPPSNDVALGVGKLTDLARNALPGNRAGAEPRYDESYRQVRARVAGRARRGRLLRWSALAGVGSLATAAVALVLAGRATPQPLTFTVAGAALGAGGTLESPPNAETQIRFSDGTAVKLERASRTRVRSTTRDGARLVLDRGGARVNVVHRKGAQWLFDAGPYVVHVTGTTFDMQWSEREQRLQVSLYTGSVTVRGPAAPNGITLRDGQVLTMNARTGVARVQALGDTQATAPGATPPEEAPAPSLAPPARAAQPARSAQPATGSWAALVAAGDFRRVLREADRQGIEDAVRRAAVADLVALADAARFAGRPAVARQVLLALRERFPSSPQAHRAAFLLGRMAEDSEGNLARAIEWYDIYLADAPVGPHLADALGRKMTATLKLHGAANARPLAREYLRRFPADTYADAARAIVGSR